jgi:hypothetical protein
LQARAMAARPRDRELLNVLAHRIARHVRQANERHPVLVLTVGLNQARGRLTATGSPVCPDVNQDQSPQITVFPWGLAVEPPLRCQRRGRRPDRKRPPGVIPDRKGCHPRHEEWWLGAGGIGGFPWGKASVQQHAHPSDQQATKNTERASWRHLHVWGFSGVLDLVGERIPLCADERNLPVIQCGAE